MLATVCCCCYQPRGINTVVGVVGEVDYRIQISLDKVKSYHINMLKRFLPWQWHCVINCKQVTKQHGTEQRQCQCRGSSVSSVCVRRRRHRGRSGSKRCWNTQIHSDRGSQFTSDMMMREVYNRWQLRITPCVMGSWKTLTRFFQLYVLGHTIDWITHKQMLRDFFERVRKANLLLKPLTHSLLRLTSWGS